MPALLVLGSNYIQSTEISAVISVLPIQYIPASVYHYRNVQSVLGFRLKIKYVKDE